MGGKPKTAMAIFAFPLATLDPSVAVEVLQGASDVIKESGAALAGGHTIDDDTMKFGLSVTGFVDPKKVWSNAGARAGDVLILTKPLGTGTLCAALKRGEASEADIADGLDSMATLNNVVDYLSAEQATAIHAATDITGFGLAGHAYNLARASKVSLSFEISNVPRFERAMEFLEKGFLTKAHRTNSEYVKDHCRFPAGLAQQLIVDPQTSGGLLLAVAADQADQVLGAISGRFPFARKIGRVIPQESNLLLF
jgi:selenide,water dikinase